MTDQEKKNCLWDNIVYNADKLTPEQLEYCVHEWPRTALAFCADKLTPEQFDYCIHKDPWAGLAYYADRLTPEQLNYCVREWPSTALAYWKHPHACGEDFRKFQRFKF